MEFRRLFRRIHYFRVGLELGLNMPEMDSVPDFFATLARRLFSASVHLRSRRTSVRPPRVCDVSAAGRIAVLTALAEWHKGVAEPRRRVTSHPILRYICVGLGWRWITKYRNRRFEWCGAFAAYCWRSAGLKAGPRKHVLPSCVRLNGKGPRSEWHSWGPSRFVDGPALPGDIMLVGKGPDGSHIALVEFEDVRGIHTIEGNSTGRGIDGRRYEGVVRQVRSRAEVRRHIRIKQEDLK